MYTIVIMFHLQILDSLMFQCGSLTGSSQSLWCRSMKSWFWSINPQIPQPNRIMGVGAHKLTFPSYFLGQLNDKEGKRERRIKLTFFDCPSTICWFVVSECRAPLQFKM